MLTPAQVRNHQFSASGRGTYRAAEVDDFFASVCDSYEQMFRENGELLKKIGLLADKVEEYKSDEDNIREALLTAQRMEMMQSPLHRKPLKLCFLTAVKRPTIY